MAQDIKKGYMRKGSGKLDRTVPRIYRYDAGPNKGTLRTKPKPKPEPVKKKPRSGNIGNIDMKGFKSSNVIIGQSDNIGKKMSPNKTKTESKSKLKNKTYTVDGKKISASSRQEALKKAKTTKRTTNAAGQRMGQRKAGGVIKAKNGTLTDKAYEIAQAREEGGRFSVSDIELAKESLREEGGRFSVSDIELAKESLNDTPPLSPKGRKKAAAMRKIAAMRKKAKKEAKQKKEKPKSILDRRKAGGMMQYNEGTGKKGVTVQARGCGLARKKSTKMS